MPDRVQRRLAEFIEPFRVPPGTRVRLAKDFDPAFKAGIEEKSRGVELLADGVRLLAEYQSRLAAQDTWGVLGDPAGARRGGEGRDDPPRHERGESPGRGRPQLQGPVGRGARPRLPLALRAAAPGPRRDRLLLTAGLVGLYMAIVIDALIAFGKSQYGGYPIGSSIALTAFALMIVVATYESRSAWLSALTEETFDNRTLNVTALVEVVLALMVTQMDGFRRLLGTEPLTGPQFLLAVAAAVGLFVSWELGKLVARRR
jgi:hypothetical protein